MTTNKEDSLKLLIFILSYNAEKHIAGVLRDIPTEYKNHPNTEILIIDDASKDKTVEVAGAYAKEQHLSNIRILKNQINQGYGGNQKVGYRYAIKKKFDVVVMLHGDGQYAPAVLPELVKPFEQDPSTGCVLGVRFGRRYSPLSGGMPFYKFIGNRVLTRFQNALAGADLREWHTGYRAYSTEALARTAFTLNTNDFHFDTEIILQMLHSRALIKQVDIPTHYGEEICHVNGIRYAKDVVKATTKFFLQKYHLFYDVRFHPEVLNESHLSKAEERPVYEDKMQATSPHSLVCLNNRVVPPGSRVLDIGCSHGYVASYLGEHKSCEVTGVDQLPERQVSARSFVYKQMNLETDQEDLHKLLEDREFDAVLLLDVLEHLAVPELFLLGLSQRVYKKPPKFVCSTANVAFVMIRFMLLFGHFNYGRKGILDITHKRLFSAHTFRNLLIQTGFIVTREHYIPFPFISLGWPKGLSRWLEKINMMLIKIRPRLFAYQILFEAEPLKTAEVVLAEDLKMKQVAG